VIAARLNWRGRVNADTDIARSAAVRSGLQLKLSSRNIPPIPAKASTPSHRNLSRFSRDFRKSAHNRQGSENAHEPSTPSLAARPEFIYQLMISCLPTLDIPEGRPGRLVTDILCDLGFAVSKSDAKRQIAAGSVKVGRANVESVLSRVFNVNGGFLFVDFDPEGGLNIKTT
jgi:hypothetical protein